MLYKAWVGERPVMRGREAVVGRPVVGIWNLYRSGGKWRNAVGVGRRDVGR